MRSDLEQRIKQRNAIICVVGAGYVGLPLIMAFLDKGFSVFAFDKDKEKVGLLNQGKNYISYINSNDLKPYVSKNKFWATTGPAEFNNADVIVICVPTPLDAHKNPDLSYVLNTAKAISKELRKGQLVVLESTTYPGTTEEALCPVLEESGLKAGKDFFLAYSPEREDPGDKRHSTPNIPKIVAGVTSSCRRIAKVLYDQIVIKTIPVSSPSVAEAAKLLENVFRSVNIALVNETKMIFDRMGLDIWEVIQASSTKPFGFMPFYPGPGLGGHCIPIDPFYLAWKAKEVDHPTRFIELAGEINTLMPYYVVSKTIGALNSKGRSPKNANILILGIAYKKDINDQRGSPGLKIISLLEKEGARVAFNDPVAKACSEYRDYPGIKLRPIGLTEENLKKFDAVVIVTDHSVYDFDWIAKNSSLLIDTRNAVKGRYKNVVKA